LESGNIYDSAIKVKKKLLGWKGDRTFEEKRETFVQTRQGLSEAEG
jgi:hypothetical protein